MADLREAVKPTLHPRDSILGHRRRGFVGGRDPLRCPRADRRLHRPLPPPDRQRVGLPGRARSRPRARPRRTSQSTQPVRSTPTGSTPQRPAIEFYAAVVEADRLVLFDEEIGEDCVADQELAPAHPRRGPDRMGDLVAPGACGELIAAFAGCAKEAEPDLVTASVCVWSGPEA